MLLSVFKRELSQDVERIDLMNIVAVIPARAGSKGVPNKNIRFLNGKPLIAYAIENAIASSYITRVIVSTDSPEVKIIAKQLGAEVRERTADLCGDAVTLDAVVFDAVKDISCDYVVTMQPTSPTLTVATLDAAIKSAIDGGYDTVIAARNRPHLAWTKNADGCVVPAYKERLNRQYLPPYYGETGARSLFPSARSYPRSRASDPRLRFTIYRKPSR